MKRISNSPSPYKPQQSTANCCKPTPAAREWLNPEGPSTPCCGEITNLNFPNQTITDPCGNTFENPVVISGVDCPVTLRFRPVYNQFNNDPFAYAEIYINGNPFGGLAFDTWTTVVVNAGDEIILEACVGGGQTNGAVFSFNAWNDTCNTNLFSVWELTVNCASIGTIPFEMAGDPTCTGETISNTVVFNSPSGSPVSVDITPNVSNSLQAHGIQAWITINLVETELTINLPNNFSFTNGDNVSFRVLSTDRVSNGDSNAVRNLVSFDAYNQSCNESMGSVAWLYVNCSEDTFMNPTWAIDEFNISPDNINTLPTYQNQTLVAMNLSGNVYTPGDGTVMVWYYGADPIPENNPSSTFTSNTTFSISLNPGDFLTMRVIGVGNPACWGFECLIDYSPNTDCNMYLLTYNFCVNS